MLDSSVREWIVTAQSFILMFWNGGFAQLEYLLFKFWVKNNMKTSILDQAVQSGLTQYGTFGELLCLFYWHFVCFRLNLTWIIFPFLLFSHQTEGNTSVQLQLQQFNSSIVFTWLLWNYLCWESAMWLWVSLNWCPNKLWEVKPGDGQSPAGSPRILAWCSEFRTLLILQVCRAPYNTSGLRGKDGVWKRNSFPFAAFSAYDPNWGSV